MAEAKIGAKNSLFVNEWNSLIVNDLDHDINIELGHTELMVKTITIKKPDAES